MPEVTEGETIDNFGNLCGPQSLASVGWRQVDDQGRLKCPFQDATGVGRARGDLKLAIPKPFDKLRPLKSLEASWGASV